MADPQALRRTRRYVGVLVMAAVIGVPVSAAAYGFLALADYLQQRISSSPARPSRAGPGTTGDKQPKPG